MKNALSLFLFAIFLSHHAHAMQWYCQRESDKLYRPIKSYDCSEQLGGKAYCKQGGKVVHCGSYGIENNKIIVTYQNSKGTQKKKMGAARTRPATQSPLSEKSSGASETTSGGSSGKGFLSGIFGSGSGKSGGKGLLSNKYPPRVAKFSRSKSVADSYANAGWQMLSLTQKGRYIRDVATEVMSQHGIKYDPNVIVCKAYRESEFRPQVKAYSKRSTASGVSQVTVSTSSDLFTRGGWFRSKVPGFEGITSGRYFHKQMVTSMPAQIELGIAVMRQKALDRGTSKMYNILYHYYGTNSASKNGSYANHILNCAKCVKSSGITRKCMEKSR